MIAPDLETGTEIKFAGEAEFVDALAEEAAATGGFEVVSKGEETDPGDLGFDFATIAALVGLVSNLVGPLVPALVKAIRRTKPRKIQITTPYGTITYEPTEDPTEDEVREVLRKLAEV
jgi:hypothetical protein